jgi:hypothetical protein
VRGARLTWQAFLFLVVTAGISGGLGLFIISEHWPFD